MTAIEELVTRLTKLISMLAGRLGTLHAELIYLHSCVKAGTPAQEIMTHIEKILAEDDRK